jgi:hypothetical protein
VDVHLAAEGFEVEGLLRGSGHRSKYNAGKLAVIARIAIPVPSIAGSFANILDCRRVRNREHDYSRCRIRINGAE